MNFLDLFKYSYNFILMPQGSMLISKRLSLKIKFK